MSREKRWRNDGSWYWWYPSKETPTQQNVDQQNAEGSLAPIPSINSGLQLTPPTYLTIFEELNIEKNIKDVGFVASYDHNGLVSETADQINAKTQELRIQFGLTKT